MLAGVSRVPVARISSFISSLRYWFLAAEELSLFKSLIAL